MNPSPPTFKDRLFDLLGQGELRHDYEIVLKALVDIQQLDKRNTDFPPDVRKIYVEAFRALKRGRR